MLLIHAAASTAGGLNTTDLLAIVGIIVTIFGLLLTAIGVLLLRVIGGLNDRISEVKTDLSTTQHEQFTATWSELRQLRASIATQPVR